MLLSALKALAPSPCPPPPSDSPRLVTSCDPVPLAQPRPAAQHCTRRPPPSPTPRPLSAHHCWLTSVELSEQSLQELRAVETAHPRLVITHPALDVHPKPPKGSISAL